MVDWIGGMLGPVSVSVMGCDAVLPSETGAGRVPIPDGDGFVTRG